MARPSKLTGEVAEAIASEIRAGMPVRYACDLAGVTARTYANWMERGEADAEEGLETAYSLFFLAIKKSYAQYVKKAYETIRMGDRGWQATAWWLERTNPFFMPKQQIQADDDGKVTVVIGGREKAARRPGKSEDKEEISGADDSR